MTFLECWQRVRMANNSRRKIYPPRVDTYDNGERYWSDPPPVLSARCQHWMKRIEAGWRPGRHISYGYYTTSTYMGVYIWEYLHVLSPMLSGGRRDCAGPDFEIGPDGKVTLTS